MSTCTVAAPGLLQQRSFVLFWFARLTSTIGYQMLALMIGFSRAYLGFHYPSDVLAGFAVGLAWLAVNILLVEAVRARLPASSPAPPPSP